jgi:hypothetical protein
MNYTTVISAVAFTVILLTSLFLFMRNYPNDRWFSLVFVVAGGCMLWSGVVGGVGDIIVAKTE